MKGRYVMSEQIKISSKDHVKFLQLIANDKRMKEVHKKANLKRRAKINILLVKAEKGGITVTEKEIVTEVDRLNKLSK